MIARSLITFIFTLTLGVSLTCSEKIENFFHRGCVRWDEATRARSLFTFKEGKQLIGKKVRFRNSKLYPHNRGQIWHLEMVGQDKFFIVIDWEVDPETGREIPLLYGKEILPNLEFEN